MGVVYIQQKLDNMDDKPNYCRICANKLGRVAYSTVTYTKLLEEAFRREVSQRRKSNKPGSFVEPGSVDI